MSQPEVIDRLVRLPTRLRLVRPDQPKVKTEAKTAPKVKSTVTPERRVLPTIWDRYYDADD